MPSTALSAQDTAPMRSACEAEFRNLPNQRNSVLVLIDKDVQGEFLQIIHNPEIQLNADGQAVFGLGHSGISSLKIYHNADPNLVFYLEDEACAEGCRFKRYLDWLFHLRPVYIWLHEKPYGHSPTEPAEFVVTDIKVYSGLELKPRPYTTPKLPREEVQKEIARLSPWFHNVDFGHGLHTKVQTTAGEPIDHPYGPFQIISRHRPEDLTGKTLLDVGCNGGFYSVEAKRRGAEYVLAIDSETFEVSQSRFVQRSLGIDGMDVELGNVYELDRLLQGRQFDYVLALGLIYHLKHPIFALEQLFNATKPGGTMYVELAIAPDAIKSVQYLGGTLHYVGFLENPTGAKEAHHNWFFPTPAAARAMINSVGFESIVVDVSKARATLVAHKPEKYWRSYWAQIEVSDVYAGETKLAPVQGEYQISHGAPGLTVRCLVTNVGTRIWTTCTDKHVPCVRLGAWILNGAEKRPLLVPMNDRADLKQIMLPDDTAELEWHAMFETPGHYEIFVFDMVLEGKAWFDLRLKEPVKLQLVVV